METAMAEATAPTTATEAGKLCTHPDCGKPALYAYTWAWGETGKCCQDHHFTLNQISQQINQPISFVALDAGVAPPMELAERIQMNAQILSLQQELDVARKRGLELYATNTKLAEEGRLLLARNNDARARVDVAQKHILDLEERNGQLLSQNAEQHAELERLRAFLPSDDHGAFGEHDDDNG